MATKVVRILSPELHDGLGGVHKQGDVVELPAEVAYVALGRHMAELVDSEAILEHVKQAKEDMHARQLAERQALAIKSMRLFDMLPPEVKAKAREDEAAVSEYIASLTPKSEQPQQPPKRRGRPPKARSADDDEKITGFRSSDGDH